MRTQVDESTNKNLFDKLKGIFGAEQDKLEGSKSQSDNDAKTQPVSELSHASKCVWQMDREA